MALQIAWLLDKLGNKLYAWSTTKAVMDFDRGGSSGQTLEKTLNDGLIQEYTCVTSGTTHALTGTGNNIKFVADAPFNEGDTITVNGSLISAYTQDGEALTGGAWATGMTVVCYLDGSTLNFKGVAVQPYKAGDTVSYGSVMLAARATTSNIQVTFPLAKPCTATSASIRGTVSIRAADSTLLANDYSFSASASPQTNTITATIPISYDTPPTNYTLVSALLTGVFFTFS